MGAYLTLDVPINLTGLNKVNFFGDVQTGKNAYARGEWVSASTSRPRSTS